MLAMPFGGAAYWLKEVIMQIGFGLMGMKSIEKIRLTL
jgi:hypothetical protein